MPPTYFGSFSMTQVGAPCLTSSYAAVRPAGPAPRMTTGSLTPNERKPTLLAPTLTRCENLDAACDAFRSPSTRSASLCRRIRSRSESQGVVRCLREQPLDRLFVRQRLIQPACSTSCDDRSPA